MRLPEVHVNGLTLLNTLDSCGWDLSLHASAIDGHEETLDQLLLYMAERGKHTESQNWYNGWTAAHWAAYCGRSSNHLLQAVCLSRLLDSCPGLVSSSSFGYNIHPLHCSAIGGALLCLDRLLVSGADANSRDALGETAAHKAARIGNLELISRLVAFGCDLSTVNVAGYTAFDVATMKGHAGCAAYLQQAQHLQMKGLCPPYMPSTEVKDLCGTEDAAGQPALMDCALPEDMVYGFVCVSIEQNHLPY
ncbi:Ank 2 domain containing protein [Trichuris trichiura]|uniref:Ank 2 domain containing protein n=1 Tax=Trichuris trichiura TaxID=36087 RepID=A0A077ZGB6_TRITR|nr:Ank 2 domain containing protein [Trichuris trichiura]